MKISCLVVAIYMHIACLFGCDNRQSSKANFVTSASFLTRPLSVTGFKLSLPKNCVTMKKGFKILFIN